MGTVTWLHLSDWHQGGPDFDRTVMRDRLLDDLRERTDRIDPRLERIDFVVFSGDLAFGGQEEEYRAAREILLDPVLEAVDLKPDRLFIVPGNHDLDRDIVYEMLPAALQEPLDDEGMVKKWLDDGRRRSRALEPFEAYRAFVAGYTGQRSPDYGSVRSWTVDGVEVALVGANSA